MVARRTGLKADLIRAWERRYGAVTPERDEDNQRSYTDQDIERLVLLRRAVEAGRAIRTVAGLDSDELRRIVASDRAFDVDPAGAFVDRVLASAHRLDPATTHRELDAAVTELGRQRALADVVAEVIHRTSGNGDAVDSVARDGVRAMLDARLAAAWSRSDSGPTVVVTWSEEDDSLDALLAAAVACDAGWRVAPIGPAGGYDTLDAAVRSLAPALVVTVAATGDTKNQTAAPVEGTPWIAADRDRGRGRLRVDALAAALRRALRRHRIADRLHRHLHLDPDDDHGPRALAPLRVPLLGPVRELDVIRGIPDAERAALVLTDLDATRRISHQLHHGCALPGATTGTLQAAALLHDFGHRLVARSCRLADRPLMADAVDMVESRFGADRTTTVLEAIGAETDLDGPDVILEEALLLRLANRNPGLDAVRALFDDRQIEAALGYHEVVDAVAEFFTAQPGLGADETPLPVMLERPLVEAPTSLVGQLELLVRLEGELSGPIVSRLLLALDVLREEQRPQFSADPAPRVTGVRDSAVAPPLGTPRYSPERDWMRELVLAARHTPVWMDQLARQTGRPVERLDQIPDAALEQLAAEGVTGLWLVGVWQRSRASARIKTLLGADDASMASAYAIDEYRVADDLGGDEAFARLAERADRHGLRLGCDVVANHTGIDARWVLDHPERFLSRTNPPFPSYTFSGDDLSSDSGSAIHLADQYLDQSDAPVVFRRTDYATGEVRFIYHGNDGTGLPWNDTAQLDVLKPETRSALADVIVSVARRVPILRLDAAMTLARQHVRRLWYPPAGGGGAIPSRSGHGLTQAEFDRLMPTEFWREVVDRVVVEAPDTLLVAEAFWMMEATFVRELGMHRVYNSAFMHHLRDEENGRLRAAIRWASEHDPEVLARHVNFLTTPDERPAADQFESGAKYRAACILMAVMPGTPLLGHGQAEGWTERYGMEFRRPRLDEAPNPDVVRFHRGELAPLLARRRDFSGVHRFRLLDAEDPDGRVNDDVIAIANRSGERPVIAVVHNRATTSRAHITRTAPFRDTVDEATRTETVAEWLGVDDGLTLRDAVSGRRFEITREPLRTHGLELELGAYEALVLEPEDGRT